VRTAGHPARLTREERPGLTAARLHAIARTGAPWMLFLDDDNELKEDFVAEGLAFAGSRDDLGCFGGRLLLPASVKPPRWAEPFLPWLGIKDAGPELLTGSADRWGPWEPPGAGCWARRELLEAYRAQLEVDARAFSLGRKARPAAYWNIWLPRPPLRRITTRLMLPLGRDATAQGGHRVDDAEPSLRGRRGHGVPAP
jgi:hypothetical protein